MDKRANSENVLKKKKDRSFGGHGDPFKLHKEITNYMAYNNIYSGNSKEKNLPETHFPPHFIHEQHDIATCGNTSAACQRELALRQENLSQQFIQGRL